jgi:hypothetical protein
MIEQHGLEPVEPADVSGVHPHPRVAGRAGVQHDGEAISDDVIRELQSVVFEGLHPRRLA